MSIQLPFGIKDGTLTHISEVDRGLECGCVCPACEQTLMARKGKKTAHHFAHYKSRSCDNAVETALHLAAKEVLEGENQVHLPGTYVQFNSFRDPFLLCKPGYLEFDRVWLEQSTEDVIPDVLIEKKGRRLALEIRVTHEVNEDKESKVRDSGMSVLEIDLSDMDRQLSQDLDLLKQVVIDGLDHKTWVYNRRAQRYHDRLVAAAQRRIIQDTGMAMFVEECPSKYRSDDDKYYALVVDDCWHCRHCLHHDRQEGIIHCGANKVDLPY